MENILTPFIDATYYENVYKPVKTARIKGTFTNVEEHKADFEPFVLRASILVDRVLMNKISRLGGFAKMSDTFDKECIMGATAATVELWYIKGYTIADIDAAINIGGTGASKKADIKTFRDMLSFTALALLQKTSMFNKQRLVGIDLEKELHDMGITVTDILTWSDALAVFEQKGLSANFHIEGDLTPELTGQAGINKYILIASTPKHLVNMTVIGGTNGIAESTIRVERDNTGAITHSELLVTSTKALADTPDFYTEIDGDKVNVYMKVANDQTNKTLVISNQFGDNEGKYGVLGSLTTSTSLTKIAKTSVLGNNIAITANTDIDDTKILEAEGR